MRVTIDRSGRVVVPKPMRDHLGLNGPAELDLVEGDGQLVLRPVPGQVTLVQRDGVLVAEREGELAPLDWEAVRNLVERQRR